ncbi:MAG TPA: ATP-dependent helicase, partial [Aromatoleum sp.]|uniref:ATP-dependent helicase n=1 Tax=Aromatoleum sp. TaxID=2307007 RepID=UPI002B4721A2
RLRAAEQDQNVADGVGPSILRDRLLSGLRFLLVDEYQDINGDHYELISAVAGRTLQTEEDRVSLMVVGDDDQNIYAFDGASVRYIRQFETDYAARRYALIENYRSTKHIIHCANRVIERARDRMKAGQAIRVNHARRDQPDGGEQTLDPLTEGRVHVLEVLRNPYQEVQVALDELQRVHDLIAKDGSAGQWGHFAVIARRWEDLEPMAALCRLRGIPVRLLRDGAGVSLHQTREGDALATLLRGQCRSAKRRRVLIRSGVLSRWFRRRFHAQPDGLIEHPQRAALAQFINDADSTAPGRELVVDDLIESLYDFGAIGKPTADARPNAPLVLMTAHRAKGLEFYHVLILDGGGWQGRGDDERRLFYVAMTRPRKSLTVCEVVGGRHPFVRDLEGLVLRSRPGALPPEPGVAHRVWCADLEKVVLSWPGRFATSAPTHRALAALDIGDPLVLRPRSDGKTGWELTDASGTMVGRMSSKFQLPQGEIVAARVVAMLVRHAREDEQGLLCRLWELALPEIEYIPCRFGLNGDESLLLPQH